MPATPTPGNSPPATTRREIRAYARRPARRALRTALEIGCSIGVLTQQLATRCDRLLAVDAAPTALLPARQRCRDLTHVEFAQMFVPGEWPARQLRSDPAFGGGLLSRRERRRGAGRTRRRCRSRQALRSCSCIGPARPIIRSRGTRPPSLFIAALGDRVEVVGGERTAASTGSMSSSAASLASRRRSSRDGEFDLARQFRRAQGAAREHRTRRLDPLPRQTETSAPASRSRAAAAGTRSALRQASPVRPPRLRRPRHSARLIGGRAGLQRLVAKRGGIGAAQPQRVGDAAGRAPGGAAGGDDSDLGREADAGVVPAQRRDERLVLAERHARQAPDAEIGVARDRQGSRRRSWRDAARDCRPADRASPRSRPADPRRRIRACRAREAAAAVARPPHRAKCVRAPHRRLAAKAARLALSQSAATRLSASVVRMTPSCALVSASQASARSIAARRAPPAWA